MAEIKYRFLPEKFIQELAYLAQAGLPDLSKLKVAKLLYFCDKYHLLKYGRPVTGDVYYCLDHGPVPSASLNLMDEAISPIRFHGLTNRILDIFEQYLTIDTDHKYPQFSLKASPPMDLFSKSEIEALDATIEKYGHMSPWQLREASHQDPTWTIPDEERPDGSRAEIPYELFFDGQPDDVKETLKLIEEEQEQSTFAERLAR